MLLDDDERAGPLREEPTGTFAFTAQARLLSALGRGTYAFMCLRWEALWLFSALSGSDPDDLDPPAGVARAESAVLALRLQRLAGELPTAHGLRPELAGWADSFAACADLHADVLRAHPGADSLWSLPTDTPEQLTLADRPEDLLGYAQRFETLALEGAHLRRQLV